MLLNPQLFLTLHPARTVLQTFPSFHLHPLSHPTGLTHRVPAGASPTPHCTWVVGSPRQMQRAWLATLLGVAVS